MPTVPREDDKSRKPTTGTPAPSSNKATTSNNTPPASPPTPAPDPFDPAALRLSADITAIVGVKKALLTVPVRKPAPSWFVRVNPDPKYQLQPAAIIELKEDREFYLVTPTLYGELATEATLSLRVLFTAVSRQGVLFLWPIRLPRADGRDDEWSRSNREAAACAQKGWVRIVANMSLGAYEITASTRLTMPYFAGCVVRCDNGSSPLPRIVGRGL
jgi:hypothetical protein